MALAWKASGSNPLEVRVLYPPPVGKMQMRAVRLASFRSAASLYGIFGEKEKDLSRRAKEIFFITKFWKTET